MVVRGRVIRHKIVWGFCWARADLTLILLPVNLVYLLCPSFIKETLSSVTEQLELQVRELARQRVTGEAREEGMKLQIATLTDRVNELEMALELAIAKNKVGCW